MGAGGQDLVHCMCIVGRACVVASTSDDLSFHTTHCHTLRPRPPSPLPQTQHYTRRPPPSRARHVATPGRPHHIDACRFVPCSACVIGTARRRQCLYGPLGGAWWPLLSDVGHTSMWRSAVVKNLKWGEEAGISPSYMYHMACMGSVNGI